MIWGICVRFSILPSTSTVSLSHLNLDLQKSFDVGLFQAGEDADINVSISLKQVKVQNSYVYISK